MKALLTFLLVAVYSMTSAQGMVKIKKIIRSEYKNLTPYFIPNINYGPGAIMVIGTGVEKRYAGKEVVFPQIGEMASSKVPSTTIEKVRRIRFDAKVDAQLLPQNVQAVINPSGDLMWSFRFEIKDGEIRELDNIYMERRLKQWDFSNEYDQTILEALLREDHVIINQALLIKGMRFTFRSDRAISADVSAEIAVAAANAGLSLGMKGSKVITIESDDSLYYAFETLGKNMEGLKKLYDDRKSVMQYEKQIAEKKAQLDKAGSIEKEIASLSEKTASIDQQIGALTITKGNKEDPELQMAVLEAKRDLLMQRKLDIEEQITMLAALKPDTQPLNQEIFNLNNQVTEIKSRSYDLFTKESNQELIDRLQGVSEED